MLNVVMSFPCKVRLAAVIDLKTWVSALEMMGVTTTSYTVYEE